MSETKEKKEKVMRCRKGEDKGQRRSDSVGKAWDMK